MAGKRLRLPGGMFLVSLVSGALGYALPGEEHPLLKTAALLVAAVALAVLVVLLIAGIVRWWRARGAPPDGLESQILNAILAEPNRPQTLEQLQAITGEAMKFVKAATEHLAAQGKVVYGKASGGGHGSARVTGAVIPAVSPEEKLSGPDRVTRREIVYDETGRVAGEEVVHESGSRDARVFPQPVAMGATVPATTGPIIEITDPTVTEHILRGAQPEPVWVARVTVRSLTLSGTARAWLLYQPSHVRRELPGRWTSSPEPTGANGHLRHEDLEKAEFFPGERRELDVAVKFGADDGCFAFSNMSYRTGWRDPDNRLEGPEIVLTVAVTGIGIERHEKSFVLIPGGPEDILRIVEAT